MAELIASGTRCYIPSDEFVWLPVKVLSQDDTDSVKVAIEDSNEKIVIKFSDRNIQLALKSQGLKNTLPHQNEFHQEGEADMIRLNHLHEPAILFNLKKRFLNGNPYTYTGNITIAVNPYQWIPELYSEKTREAYAHDTNRETLPPHVFATSLQAYEKMRLNGVSQSILVSGESGAGKTETTKILMNHVGYMAGGSESQTINRIIQVTPLLECFGNAKTTRNDNSSRFGKFTQLQFDTKNTLVGAKCQTYLLEKTRVIGHDAEERNYHIFYQLLSAPKAEAFKLLLDKDTKYKYIGDIQNIKIEGLSDSDHFLRTKESLGLIGIAEDLQQQLFRLLSGILNLGQIEFDIKDGDDEASIMIKSPAAQNVAELCNINLPDLEKALCSRSMTAVREVYVVPLKVDQAVDCRDALSKAIYSNLFNWLVKQINSSLSNDSECKHNIAILDIFGFEHFEHNSFEQFCINFANEKLQQKFTQDVFKTVQLEYEEEGITWSHIEFADNQDVLSVIEGKMGIISLLNEELMRPKGTEEGFVSKVATLHKEDSGHVVEFPKSSRTQFVIQHYAAPVKYEATGFLEKHKDALLPDLSSLMRSSNSEFLKSLFPAVKETATTNRGRKKGSGGLRNKNVGTQFKESLSSLMENIQATDVHYVRCIKPNSVKSPSVMDQAMVVSQLRCAGVIEAIRISRTAYPNRMPHSEFVDTFRVFATKYSKMSLKDQCVSIAELFTLKSPVQYQMGLSKIYFQLGVLDMLNDEKSKKLSVFANIIQLRVKGFSARCRYIRIRSAAVKLQSLARCIFAMNKFTKARFAILRTQTGWRGKVARRRARFVKQVVSIIRIQSTFRRYRARKQFLKKRSYVILVQSKIRMYVHRKNYQDMVMERKEEADMKTKANQLQDRLKREQVKNSEQSPSKSAGTSSADMDTVMQDAGGMISKLQSDNAKLRASLRLYKSSNKELREKAENLRSDREVLVASNHVKTFNFEKKIKDQNSQLKTVREEYSKLHDFIATNMPDADIVQPSAKKQEAVSGFAYFHKFAATAAASVTTAASTNADSNKVDSESNAVSMVKNVGENIERQLEQTRDDTSRFLRASAQRMKKVAFWNPVPKEPSEKDTTSTVGGALQSVTNNSFFGGAMFSMKKSSAPLKDIESEAVNLDDLPSSTKSNSHRKNAAARPA